MVVPCSHPRPRGFAVPSLVSYELQDDEGRLLESVEHAVLNEGWWKSFQPMRRRFG
ncbi:MAG: hypothetical protein WA687_08325 [Solirubrobacterales bacterium]